MRQKVVGGALVVLTAAAVVVSPPAFAAGETVSAWITTADQSKLLARQPNRLAA